MAKLNKRFVDGVDVRDKDYFVWDEELPGFGIRVFTSGKMSYLIQYRSLGRTRRFTIGLHGIWTPETARREAKILLGRVANGENPSEEKQVANKAMTVKELCTLYCRDMELGLVLGKGGRPKKPQTVLTDSGRVMRHIVPLFGTRRVQDLTRADIANGMKDIMLGKTRAFIKTRKLRGRANVRGGIGTAVRTIGLFGGILTYAVEAGVIETNPAHGIRKPKYKVRTRRLSEAEFRLLGDILRRADARGAYQPSTEITRLIALTGCRRGEIIGLRWREIDFDGSCLRLIDSKEGESVRPVGLAVIERLEALRPANPGEFVFPGTRNEGAFGSFPNHWEHMVNGTDLADVTPHVLRHSFASLANDLGFTEATVASLVGHSTHSVTSKYIHTMDTALVMAADTVAGYVQGLLDGQVYRQAANALDRDARAIALASFLQQAAA